MIVFLNADNNLLRTLTFQGYFLVLYIQGRLCGLVVPEYSTEMYCVSCEIRTEFIYVMYKKVTASVV
jgi:hypothetical protein